MNVIEHICPNTNNKKTHYKCIFGHWHEGELEAIARGAPERPDTLHVGWVGVGVVGAVEGPAFRVQIPSAALDEARGQHEEWRGGGVGNK